MVRLLFEEKKKTLNSVGLKGHTLGYVPWCVCAGPGIPQWLGLAWAGVIEAI
jgi:hypothetical protein